MQISDILQAMGQRSEAFQCRKRVRIGNAELLRQIEYDRNIIAIVLTQKRCCLIIDRDAFIFNMKRLILNKDIRILMLHGCTDYL